MAILYEKTFESNLDGITGGTLYTLSSYNIFTQPVCRVICSNTTVLRATITIPAGLGGCYIFIPLIHISSASGSSRNKYFKFKDVDGNVLGTTPSNTDSNCCLLYEIPVGTVKIELYASTYWSTEVSNGVYIGGIWVISPDMEYCSPILSESGESKIFDIDCSKTPSALFSQMSTKTSYMNTLTCYSKYNDGSTATMSSFMGTFTTGVSTFDGIRINTLSNSTTAFENFDLYSVMLNSSNNMQPTEMIHWNTIFNHNPLKVKASFPIISPLDNYTSEQVIDFKFKGDDIFDCILTPIFSQSGDLSNVTEMTSVITVKSGETIIDTITCNLLTMTASGVLTVPKTYTETDLTITYSITVTGSVTDTSSADVSLNMSLEIL